MIFIPGLDVISICVGDSFVIMRQGSPHVYESSVTAPINTGNKFRLL